MKKLIAALLSGTILALSWPTYGIPFLLLFSFVPLLWMEFEIRNSSQKRKAWSVFFFAFIGFYIFNFVAANWLYYATLGGMIFATVFNAVLMATVFTAYHHIAKKTSFTTAVVFLTALWICYEYLHLNWEFSLPWLNLGNGFSEYVNVVQWYEYTGVLGGTLWVWMVNIALFKSLLLYKQHGDKDIIYRGVLKSVLLIGVPIGFSYYLLHTYPDEKKQEELEVLILQPNIDPYHEKYMTDDEKIGKLLKKMVNENISDSTQLIVAPETVFADGTDYTNFDQSIPYRYSEEILQEHPDVSFIAGIVFYELIHNKEEVKPQTNPIKPGLWFNDYNTAFISKNDEDYDFYNKSKLVIGVETLPYPGLLKPLMGDLLMDFGGTVAVKTTQDTRDVFNLDPETQTGPIICYESVYGEFVNGYVKNGAEFLTIITNDGWWEDTQGYKQHMSYARLRAIESRRDIARSANTGTSAIINQKGAVLQHTNYDERAIIKGKIHKNDKVTFYVQHGDYIARLSGFMAVFIILFAFTRRRKTILDLKK